MPTVRPSNGPLLACLLVIGAAGCGFDTTTVGNFIGTCPASSTCSCNAIGNCEYSCPGGGCTLTCGGTSNCIFSCAGGGCDITCQNVGNCISTCSGDGCHMTCTGTGNCSLSACPTPATCTRDCRNIGTCS